MPTLGVIFHKTWKAFRRPEMGAMRRVVSGNSGGCAPGVIVRGPLYYG